MVARCGERIRQLPENSLAVVLDFAGLAVKKFRRPDDSPSERRPDRLMPQANPKNRKLRGETLDEFHGNACLLRRAWARRNHDLLRLAAGNLFHGNLVVAMHLHLAAQLAEILRQVVGKRVVVVEQQDHRGFFRGAMPRGVRSISSMISIARTLGAPDTVPAGKQAIRASKQSTPSRNRPRRLETRCIT